MINIDEFISAYKIRNYSLINDVCLVISETDYIELGINGRIREFMDQFVQTGLMYFYIERENCTINFLHLCFKSALEQIERDGLKPSWDGNLGTGVYVFDTDNPEYIIGLGYYLSILQEEQGPDYDINEYVGVGGVYTGTVLYPISAIPEHYVLLKACDSVPAKVRVDISADGSDALFKLSYTSGIGQIVVATF